MSKTSTVTINRRVNETAEERRIREEELCWRRYAKEKAAEEKEKVAQMNAMFEAHQNGTDEGEYLDYTIPEERTARGERRRGTYRSKEKCKKNARAATANKKAREERDKMSGTHRKHGTGEKVNGLKSQSKRTRKLVKMAEKVGRRK